MIDRYASRMIDQYYVTDIFKDVLNRRATGNQFWTFAHFYFICNLPSSLEVCLKVHRLEVDKTDYHLMLEYVAISH